MKKNGINRFKKIVVCGALMMSTLNLVACGSDEKDKVETAGTQELSDSISNDSTSLTESNEDLQESIDTEEEGSEVGNSDLVIEMSYDEAVEYLDTLPYTDTAYFEITTEEMPEGEAAIDYYSGSDKIVIVPDEIDGLKITQFNKWSFTNNEDIVAIKAPTSLRVIDDSVFVNCISLKYVTNLLNLEVMGDSAFLVCDVHYFEFSEKLTDIPYSWDDVDPTHLRVPKDSTIAEYAKQYNEEYGDEHFIIEEY